MKTVLINFLTASLKYSICLLCCLYGSITLAQNKYQLIIHAAPKGNLEKSDALQLNKLGLKTVFSNKDEANGYIYKITAILMGKGFPAASVDSVYDTDNATHIILYTGTQYKWINVNTDSIDKKILSASGWDKKFFSNTTIDFNRMQLQQQKLLDYFETKGYPFAVIKLDSISIEEDKIKALLKVDKGPLYHVDSIKIRGKVKIKNLFLQRYLEIKNGSLYNKNKLQNISKRIADLPYLQEQQPWDLKMLGSGSVLNLYLKTKPSSQVNFLVGFLPSSTGKTLLTADVNLNLKNALGAGENIILNWQQLQKQSPRLNLGYQHPYIFKSPFGIDVAFDLLKRDSNFLQINGQIGLQYILSAKRSAKIFLQNQRTFLLSGGYDTNQIKLNKRLPANIDVSASSVGVEYEWNTTDYLYNPRSGNELKITTATGLKKITKNNEIASLKDPSFNFNSLYDSLKLKTYQLRLKVKAAHYFPVAKRATIKTELNSGIFSSLNIFRNELFQIGGNKLLRGFNEETIFATQYAVFTAEYRYVTATNSYLFLFSDAGFTRTKFQSTNFTNNFISAGLGINFEAKFGILNVSYAIGKRNDVKFNLREASKIHFGYINYF